MECKASAAPIELSSLEIVSVETQSFALPTMSVIPAPPMPPVPLLGPAPPGFATASANMPGTLPPLLGVLPVPHGPPAAPVATAIASSTAQQVAGVVHQLIQQVMQGPGAGAAPAAPPPPEAVRLNIVRVIEFSLADSRVGGRLYLGFETQGREAGAEARPGARPDILCVEVGLCLEWRGRAQVELAEGQGKCTQLCSAHRREPSRA